jgi:hypothetical protein
VVAGWLVVAGCLWCTSWSRGAKKNTQISKDSTTGTVCIKLLVSPFKKIKKEKVSSYRRNKEIW